MSPNIASTDAKTSPPRPHVFPPIGPLGLIRLGRAIQDWQREGAQWIDIPWCAPNAFVQATRPAHVTGLDVDTPHGQLVASGEQSLCWLAHHHLLPQTGLVIGWSPCFRDEDFDSIHHYGFIKAELFAWVEPWTPGTPNMWHALYPKQLRPLIRTAQRLFHEWIKEVHPDAPEPTIIPSGPDMWDIVWNGIELGSYGCRLHPTLGRPYLYGTALAEPRLSTALGMPQA